MTEKDRVRHNSPRDVNRRIDLEMREVVRITAAAGTEAIDARLEELDAEWDVQRYLELTAATIASTGALLLALRRDRRWVAFPLVVMGFLAQHAIHGWCPPLVFFRNLGVRTRKEIDREKFALKAMRGDFESVADPVAALRAAGI